MKFRTRIESEYLTLSSNNLNKKSVEGGMSSLIAQILSFLIMIVSIMVLARLLTPADYGLIAIVTGVQGFLILFKDFGLSIAIIQKKKITNLEISSLFWLNVFIGLFFTTLFILSSGLIAAIFDDERLKMITIALSSTFIIGSVSIVHHSLFKRKMQFKQLMYIQIGSSFIGALSAVLSALYGVGYWALVINLIVSTLVNSIMPIWILRWIPTYNFTIKSIMEYLHVGKNIALFDFINYFSRNLDNLLIGKFYGPSILGYYSKAYQLLLLPVQQIRGPIQNVALPALSALKDSPFDYNNYYIKLSAILNVMSISIVCFMWLNSYEIIYIVLGEKWIFSAELFSILAFAALIQPIKGTLGLVLITLGQTNRYVRWGVLNFLIIGLSFIIGIYFDIIVFATLYVIANYISFALSVPYTLKDTPINIKSFLIELLVPFGYFVFISYNIMTFLDLGRENIVQSLIVKSFIFLFFFILFILLFPKYRKILFTLKDILKKRDKNEFKKSAQ